MKTTILYRDEHFFSNHAARPFWRSRRRMMTAFMLASDLVCILGSVSLPILLWQFVRPELLPELYQPLILPVTAFFVSIYLMMGLYPGMGVGPVEELRRLSIGTTLGMLVLMGLSFYLRNINLWSRAVLGLTWFFLVISAPLMRKIFRRLAVLLGMWGLPVVVMGETSGVGHIYHNLRRNRLTGFWPVLCVRTTSIGKVFSSSPNIKNPEMEALRALVAGIEIIILVPQRAPLEAVKRVLLDKTHSFKRIIVMFDDARMGSVWFTPLHLVEHLGLEVTHQLINPTQRVVKRFLDLFLIFISLPLLLPLWALIALAIKLDSPGPVFYTQKRVGHDGKEILIWKFRSMVQNAEAVLQKYLASDPKLHEEWQHSFKLKNDPRVTRVGRLLRRTSLDELPQLWNVLRGEMSLIGPRPIVTEEIPLYGDYFEIYKQVVPGMTGLWQISGRNDTTYQERVNLDVYYVQNWSIWLDIHILIHTVLTALQGRGAY
ncbi:MAG: undecaprenyl-phosphate galactose phosphotransferase WbaP [Anaerolineales bacterium]|nr:undecaprenyl-phosphate galactose phosphotransferase WbaP [Anaerolineales bacterium]MDW8276565.1 undecaprenyl-phosphate galactose phosphotransferase WbaP [Anaerolineales bacterium]